jgi:CubicO group peptidase (beta-lactamase class C family)
MWLVLLVMVCSALLVPATRARASAEAQVVEPLEGLMDPQEVERHWDAFFARGMEAYGVHGALMVMVNEGEVLFAKGYGYADAAARAPMDPGRTILRAGSIAKTVTALAVLQLAEAGELDLDADVNDYLTRFKVPDTYPAPVTARQLINMTAGFDTRAIGIRAPSREQVRPLSDYLAERMPPRVLPPGRIRRYNDHEIALAGYLVEVVSGIPYEAYVRTHIFEPLEMEGSSVLLPEDQLERVARGYPVDGGPEEAYPLSYYYLNDAPGAGFNTTALDMAHYLSAHLNGGRYDRSDGTPARVLDGGAMEAMHTTAFQYHPLLPGQANSFDEKFFNGHRYLRKLGGAPGMQNSALLLLDQGLGFYLFVNSDGTGLRNDWGREVLKMFLSAPVTAPVGGNAPSRPPARSVDYAGRYRAISDQTSDTTIVMVQALMNPDLWIQVEPNPDGSLDIDGGRALEVEPGVFRYANSGYPTAFEVGEGGRAEYLFQSRTAFERVPWVETSPVQLALLGFAVTVFLSGVVVSAIRLVRGAGAGSALSGLVSGLNLVFLVGLAWVLAPVATGGDIWQFSFDPSIPLRAVLAIPLLSAGLAVGELVRVSMAWAAGRGSRAVRLHDSLILAGASVFLFFLHTWNLLGWRF